MRAKTLGFFGRSIGLAMLVLGIAPKAADAKVAGYPYLDNETLGLFNAFSDAVDGPVDQFEDVYWGLDLLAGLDGGDAMNPLRYFIAFSGYAVAQTAVFTPAWRAPYRQALKGYIEKMLLPLAWRDWLEVWGGDNPLGPDNIMYSGHLVMMMTQYRQLFGDTEYEQGFGLVGLDGAPLVESDAVSLATWLSEQAAGFVDNAGEPTYSIACEPGRIFVPCNAPHRLNQITVDGLYGSALSETNADWLAWLKARLLDASSGVLHELYFPFGAWTADPAAGKAPEVYANMSGLYNGWSIWFLSGLDAEWAHSLHDAWEDFFVVSGDSSPYADGRTIVLDRSGLDGIGGLAFEVGSTGFGLILARLFDEPALYEALLKSWALQFGEPGWDPSGRVYAFTYPVFPRLIQNGFPLLARTTTETHNLGENAKLVRDKAFFAAPHIASISDRRVFVNQAFWDAEKAQLVLTVNGGAAIQEAVTVTIVGLDPTRTWRVVRDGAPFEGAVMADGVLTLTTAALTAEESSYVTSEAPAPDPELGDGGAAGDEAGGGRAPDEAAAEPGSAVDAGAQGADLEAATASVEGDGGCGVVAGGAGLGGVMVLMGLLGLLILRRRCSS